MCGGWTYEALEGNVCVCGGVGVVVSLVCKGFQCSFFLLLVG